MDHFGLTLDEYMAMTNPERGAFALRNINVFLNQKQYKADLEVATKYGLTVDEWSSKSQEERWTELVQDTTWDIEEKSCGSNVCPAQVNQSVQLLTQKNTISAPCFGIAFLLLKKSVFITGTNGE